MYIYTETPCDFSTIILISDTFISPVSCCLPLLRPCCGRSQQLLPTGGTSPPSTRQQFQLRDTAANNLVSAPHFFVMTGRAYWQVIAKTKVQK
jgi:hypothetical protein